LKKKIHKLAFKPEYQFLLIGISSHQNDYRISWAINKQFNLKLSKTENLKIFNEKLSVDQFFSLYTYEDENSLSLYNLIANRCHNGFLMEELKNIDFLLQIYGETNDTFIKNLISGLKQIDIIITSFKIDPNTLKSRQKLLF